MWAGVVKGNSISQNSFLELAPDTFASSRYSLGMVRNESAAIIVPGKKRVINRIKAMGASPNPNQMIAKGSQANGDMWRMKLMVGRNNNFTFFFFFKV